MHYDAGVRNRHLQGLVAIGGATSLTLTFFHPALWLAVGVFAGLATMILALGILHERHAEPPLFFLALAWALAAAVMAVAWGAVQELYNFRQVGFLLCGLLFGYLVSIARAPPFAAWAPFCAMALYFSLLGLAGRDPGSAFPRNSENYLSAVLLAHYATAVLLTRPARIRPAHLFLAAWMLALSVWSTGRSGVIASLFLVLGTLAGLALQGRRGFSRALVASGLVLSLALVVVAGAAYLLSHGYLEGFAARGIHDAPRLSIISNYFTGIRPGELLFGKNYYHEPFMAKWGYNLHNSYLSAWSHLGLAYLLLMLAALAVVARNFWREPVIGLAVLAFAMRAMTDTHLLAGQYDFVPVAALFLLLRRDRRGAVTPQPQPSPS